MIPYRRTCLRHRFQSRPISPSREKTLHFSTSLVVSGELYFRGQGKKSTLCLENLSWKVVMIRYLPGIGFLPSNCILTSKFVEASLLIVKIVIVAPQSQGSWWFVWVLNCTTSFLPSTKVCIFSLSFQVRGRNQRHGSWGISVSGTCFHLG